MRLAVKEKNVNEVEQNLYGNLYVKLVSHLSTKEARRRDMRSSILQASLVDPSFKKELTRKGIETVTELLRHFDKPNYHKFKKNTTRRCHGQECSIMGGRKQKRTRRR